MKIALGSDHGGFQMKEMLCAYLEEQGYEVLNLGTYDEKSVDYPEYGRKVGKAVVSGEADLGIVVCGTGIGISMAANKVKGVRAALCTNEFMAEMSRRHNNANVLSLGGRVIGPELAKNIVKVWLNTEFDGGRHANRIRQFDAIEQEN